MSVFGDSFQESSKPLLMDQHGEPVTYTPAGGEAVAITGMVDREPDRTLFDGMGTEEARKAMVEISTDADGVASPARGDVVTFDGKDWKILGRDVEPGLTMATLFVENKEVKERARPTYREDR